jgi:hypothetical protein
MKKQSKVKMWYFDEWFEAKHYSCPGGGEVSTTELKKRAARALKVSNDAAALYKERLQWDDSRASAMKAWRIKDREKLPERMDDD